MFSNHSEIVVSTSFSIFLSLWLCSVSKTTPNAYLLWLYYSIETLIDSPAYWVHLPIGFVFSYYPWFCNVMLERLCDLYCGWNIKATFFADHNNLSFFPRIFTGDENWIYGYVGTVLLNIIQEISVTTSNALKFELYKFLLWALRVDHLSAHRYTL